MKRSRWRRLCSGNMWVMMRCTAMLALGALMRVAGSAGAQEGGGVDVHVHLQLSPHAEERALAVKALIAKMDRRGVRWAVLVAPPQVEGQAHTTSHEDLAALAAMAPDRLAIGGGGLELNRLIHAHPPEQVTDEHLARLRREADRLAAAGVAVYGELAALHLSFNPQHVFEQVAPDHPLFLELALAAARHKIPIDLHMEAVPEAMAMPAGFARRDSRNPPTLAPNIAALERLCAHARGAAIVWQHIGWDNTGAMTVPLLTGLLARNANLYLALRVEDRFLSVAGEPMPNRIVDPEGAPRAEWLELFRRHPDRILIGSDEFIAASEHGRFFPRSFDATWALAARLPADLAGVSGANARRVYRLPGQ